MTAGLIRSLEDASIELYASLRDLVRRGDDDLERALGVVVRHVGTNRRVVEAARAHAEASSDPDSVRVADLLSRALQVAAFL